jgi:hypothetical protein
VTLRVRIPGALYRLAFDACGHNNRRLNTAICRLLEREDWLEQVVAEIEREGEVGL